MRGGSLHVAYEAKEGNVDAKSEAEWRNAREVVLVRILRLMGAHGASGLARESLEELLDDAVLVLSAAAFEIDELRGRIAELEAKSRTPHQRMLAKVREADVLVVEKPSKRERS